MIINCIYPSISGEVGTVIKQGQPCLIIRTQGCNLSCYYCDAPETQSFSEEYGIFYPIQELIQIIQEHDLPVLLTGGEPLTQQDCLKFLQACEFNDIDVQVETNGTLKLPNVSQDIGFIVDYKSKGSFCIIPESDLTENDYVKFVVTNKRELHHACDTILYYYEESPCTWAISPVQGNEYRLSGKDISEYIIKNKIPAVLNLQLQKYIDIP